MFRDFLCNSCLFIYTDPRKMCLLPYTHPYIIVWLPFLQRPLLCALLDLCFGYVQIGRVCISLLRWPGAFCWDAAAWKKWIWCENRQPYVIFNPAALLSSFELPTEFNIFFFSSIALACHTVRATIHPHHPVLCTPADICRQLDVQLQRDEDHVRNHWFIFTFIVLSAACAPCNKTPSFARCRCTATQKHNWDL